MAKKAFIICACLIAVIVVASIIISLVNLKPVEFQCVVSYENETTTMISAPLYANVNDVSNDIPLLSSLIRHDRIIMVSSIFIILIFALLFYGAKRSRG